MQILTIDTNHANFTGKGKPISLQYIVEKRKDLLPKRVLDEASKCKTKDSITLMELHKKIYDKLLEYTNLEDLKRDFPEFKEIACEVNFERNSKYAKNFKEKVGNNFVLRMIQEFWGKLKTKEEVAQNLGMTSRSSLEWALKKIRFVRFSSNYLNLLKASDPEGNKIIASKTTSWNQKNQEKMLEHNKKAAQSCKTKKYRQEQSQRMKEYDKKHPERISKISENDKKAWALCPEIRTALAEFSKNQTDYIKNILRKRTQGVKLKEEERISLKSFYKKFWETYPQYKKAFSEAKKKAAGNT